MVIFWLWWAAISSALLYNQSITAGVVPSQLKAAVIKPVPKINKPQMPSDYRPISITAVQSRLLERQIVHSFIYPALQQPPDGLFFGDQFGFRPTGSTTAALIALIHTVLTMLSSNAYVRVFALDFSKAFDTVRHAELIDKMTNLQMPDQVFNWIKDFWRSYTLYEVHRRDLNIRQLRSWSQQPICLRFTPKID